MPNFSARQKAIFTAIGAQIKKHGITSLVFNKEIAAQKTIVGIFEYHDDAVPNSLTRLVADILPPDAIAIEQSVEHTAYLESMRAAAPSDIDPDGDPYQMSLQELATMVMCPLVCIDAPEKIRRKRNLSERDLDTLRNSFMAQILAYFTPGKTIITINGIAHYADLWAQINEIDTNIRKIALFYSVDEAAKEASIKPDKQNSSKFRIVTPNEEALKTPEFRAQLRQVLTPAPAPLWLFARNMVFFRADDDERAARYPFIHASSKDAMLAYPPLEPVDMCLL